MSFTLTSLMVPFCTGLIHCYTRHAKSVSHPTNHTQRGQHTDKQNTKTREYCLVCVSDETASIVCRVVNRPPIGEHDRTVMPEYSLELVDGPHRSEWATASRGGDRSFRFGICHRGPHLCTVHVIEYTHLTHRRFRIKLADVHLKSTVIPHKTLNDLHPCSI